MDSDLHRGSIRLDLLSSPLLSSVRVRPSVLGNTRARSATEPHGPRRPTQAGPAPVVVTRAAAQPGQALLAGQALARVVRAESVFRGGCARGGRPAGPVDLIGRAWQC